MNQGHIDLSQAAFGQIEARPAGRGLEVISRFQHVMGAGGSGARAPDNLSEPVHHRLSRRLPTGANFYRIAF